MIYRTTFSLDSQTVETIKKLSAFWNVPQAEVVRRSIAQAASDLSDRKEVIQQLQDYWTQNANTHDYRSQKLEDYLIEVAEDRKSWRTEDWKESDS